MAAQALKEVDIVFFLISISSFSSDLSGWVPFLYCRTPFFYSNSQKDTFAKIVASFLEIYFKSGDCKWFLIGIWVY